MNTNESFKLSLHTDPLEVLLNIPPIQIYIQGEARSAVYRYITSFTWRTQIPAREDWENGPPMKAEITWYADGSKTQEEVGTGIYEPRTKRKISIPMASEIVATDTPIIGVLSQETYIISGLFPNVTYDSYIAASYVKFVESAGARAVPVWIGQDESYYRRVVDYTNGLLFPGGGTYFNETGGYGEAATYLYRFAIDSNRSGNYYPIWGTCLGMQVLMYASLNGTKDVRLDCSLTNVAIPLNFSKDYENSRMFSRTPDETINILKSKNVTYNQHRYCLTKASLKENDLLDDWQILATNIDSNGLEFISAMEHRTYPLYGVQFHPEKNQFEFKKNKGFPHSEQSVRVAQHFANFFVGECRKNANRFPNDDVEVRSLIYNFNPKYTGMNNSYYEQIYTFVKKDFERVQLL